MPCCPYTPRVQQRAVRLVAADGFPYRVASRHLCRGQRALGPYAAIQNRAEAAGGKVRATPAGSPRAAALADSSGYLATDAVGGGPFCILPVVDDRQHNRRAVAALDGDPTQDDGRALLGGFPGHLGPRGRVVCGITTGGWSLYPKVLAGRWPGVPHRLCEFHALKEITKAVWHAPAELRKGRAAGIPEPPRGQPGEQQRGRARATAGQAQRVAALFGHRHLLVRQQLSAAPQGVLRERTRGRPQ